jgi:signal transduction histidine kinase
MILCLKKGFTPSTPALFASSIWTLATFGQNYELSYQLGNLGLKLVEVEPYKVLKHTVYHLSTLNYFNWKNHYREAVARLDEAVKLSIEAGDHNYAVFCFTNARLIDIFRGIPLRQLDLQKSRSKGQLLNINFISKSHTAYISYLTGRKAGLTEGKFKFSKILKQQTQENLNGKFHLNFIRQLLYFQAGNYQKAFEAGSICENLRILYQAFPIGNEHDFYYCMVLFLHGEEKGVLPEEHREVIESRLQEISRLSALGSGNFLHKQKILEAEFTRADGKVWDSVSLYDEAIEEALRQEFIQLAALAAERCGDLLIKLNKKRLAEFYLCDAFRYYQQWQADAKLDILKKKYPGIQFSKPHHSFNPEQHLQSEQESLRWELVQSALNISQELYVNDLIGRVLKLSVEQTQAKNASFLLKQQFSWQVVARLGEDGLEMVLHNLPSGTMVSHNKTLFDCLKLNEIYYVPRLSERHDLYDVEYFQNRTVHSFLVVPFERHQEILGLIYLENISVDLVEQNNLLPWFELLRTQTGIALSNAQLFENQIRLNQEVRKQEQKRLDAVVETQEKERRRVAAELHDHLGQILALTKLNLTRLEDSLEGQFKLYEETCMLLDESCSELRRISHDMMPPDIENKDLPRIIEEMLRKYLPAAGLDYHFEVLQVSENLPMAVKFNLYRMLQEIVHNTIKHAQAKKLTIEMNTDEDKLHLTISDDGKGFDTQFKTDGLGLRNLYNRVNLLNGRLDIESGLNKGSIFHIHIPVV